ncbi:hypothetical protein ACEPPN_015067 [Leptodophora sp. 'Broadleaf-Isolate-01']
MAQKSWSPLDLNASCGISDHEKSEKRVIETQGGGREGSQFAEADGAQLDWVTNHRESSSPKVAVIDEEPTCPSEGEYCGRDPKNSRKLWCCPGLRCTSQFDDWPTCRFAALDFPSTTALKV